MIPKNPLTMLGTIDRCWLFTFQTPIGKVKGILPPSLDLVTHGEFAFWNVVVSHIHSMRPKPLPAFLGMSYWHVGYRLYVRFRAKRSDPIEGLYFVRSDCGSAVMSAMGNLLTDFNFHTAKIDVQQDQSQTHLTIQSPDTAATVDWTANDPMLPTYSAFVSLSEAASWLKYKPFGISVNAHGDANIVKIVRNETAWKNRLIHVTSAHWQFFIDKEVKPKIGYQVEPIEYQ